MVRRCGVGDDRVVVGDAGDDDGNGVTTIDTRVYISVNGGGEIKRFVLFSAFNVVERSQTLSLPHTHS